jgi:hypothetical protein
VCVCVFVCVIYMCAHIHILDTERADRYFCVFVCVIYMCAHIHKHIHRYLRSGLGVPNIGKYSTRSHVSPGQLLSDFTGEQDYDTAQAKLALQAHTPGVNIGKESKRAEFASAQGASAALGPGTYEVDDSLVHPRVQSAFISSTVVRESKDDREGDELVLDPTAADALVTKRVPAPVNMAKTGGRVDPRKDPIPEALDYVTDERDRVKPGEPIPGVKALKFDGQVGRVERKDKDDGAQLFGKYNIDYSLVEKQAPAADFSHVTARHADGANETEDTRDGDVLWLEAVKAHEFLRGSRKLVLDMSKQVARPEEVAGQLVSDFTGDTDYDTAQAKLALQAHTPGVNIGKESKRAEFASAQGASAALGPGTYEVDDSLVHPRVQSAFISSTVVRESKDDREGDELVLDPTAADALVTKRVPAPVNMAKTGGRVDPRKDPIPEALDYVTDERDRVKPGEPIPGVKALKFDGQVGRVERKDKDDGAQLFGKYNIDYSLVEKQAPAADFSHVTARHVEGNEAGDGQGDVLVLREYICT